MKRSPDCVLRDVGGQGLLVPLGAKVRDMNVVITLNPAGRRIWEMLAEDSTAEGLAAKIAREFGADPARARADVLSFLARLGGLGLLEP